MRPPPGYPMNVMRPALGSIVDAEAPWVSLRCPPAVTVPQLRCYRCRRVEKTPLPVEVARFVRKITAFIRTHRQCRATK